MNTLSLNIGLAVGNVESATETLDPLTALHAIGNHLPATRVKEWYVRVHPMTGELTLVVRLATRIAGPNTLAPCIHDLCLALRQDCISGKLAVRGEGQPKEGWNAGEEIHEFLTGPKAADYGGAFDPTCWLPVTCDNAPQSTGVTMANLYADRTLAGWTLGRMESDPMVLWFEHDNGTDGNCYLEIGAQVDLVDADGTVELPKPVITMLRQAGVMVSPDFE
jgi:hypothetical protein